MMKPVRRLLLATVLACAPPLAAPPAGALVPAQGAALLDPSPPPAAPRVAQPRPPPPDTPPAGPTLAMPPPGPADGPIGTPHPAVIPDVDPAGRWVLVCQARQDTDGNGWIGFGIGVHGIIDGDDAALYLVRGSGDGEPIRGVIARDVSGRWLVVADDRERIVLLDIERNTGTALFPAIRSAHDEIYPLKPSSIAFDPAGEHLLYRRRVEQRILLAVRHLDSGSEQLVDPGPGELLEARWHRGGAWLRTEVLRGDRNGDGRVERPKAMSSPWEGTCGVGSTSYLAGRSPDTVTEHIAWTTGLRVESSAARTFGDELLVDEAGATVAISPSGARRTVPLAPDCRPIFGDTLHAQIIADCGGREQTRLESLSGAARRPIGRVARDLYQLQLRSPRYLELLFLDDHARWLDLERRRLVVPRGHVAAVHGHHALVVRGERVVLLDLTNGAGRVLGRDRLMLGRPPALGDARLVLYGSWLVDLERGKLLAHVDATVRGVTTDGNLLVETYEHDRRWRPWKDVPHR